MGTIANLVISMTADPTGVQAGVAKAAAAMNNLSQSVAATARDFARAGATTAQIVQLTGASLQTAKNAVQVYGNTIANTGAEVLGLAAAQQEMAVAGIGATSAINTTGAGLSRLRTGVTSAIASMTGMPPILARIASTLGVMELGTEAVLGGLAAVAAGVVVWKAWHDDASKAAEEQKKLTGELIKWYDAQKNNGADAFLKQIDATTSSLRTLHATLDGIMASKFFSGTGVVGEEGSAWKAWLRIFTAGDPVAIATQFRIEMAKGTAIVVKGIAEDSAAIRAAGRQAFLDAQTATQSALSTRTGDLSTVIGAGRGTTGQIAEASSMLQQYNKLLGDLQRAYGGIADAQLKAFNLSQQASAVANIKALQDALKPKDAFKDFEKQFGQLLSLGTALRKVGDPINDVVEQITKKYTKLLELLQDPKLDPWSDQAVALRKLRAEVEEYLKQLTKAGLTGGGGLSITPSHGTIVATPTTAALPAGPSLGEARLRVAIVLLEEGVVSAGVKLRDFAASTFFATLRSIASQLNPFAQIITAINTAATPLVPVMAELAAIVAKALAPVFKAFAPVLEQLLPLIDAIFRVLSPILAALAPLFQAFIPILNALFPVIKFVAIVFTYVVEAASYLAGILFNVAGGIAVAIGGLIAAIGSIISKIPFLGGYGRNVQDFGNFIKDLGKGFESAANGLFQTADDMAKARDEINGVNIDPAQTALDGLTTAANAAAGSLLNVPTGYKIALARFNATTPVTGSNPISGGPPVPTPTPVNPNYPKIPVPGSPSGSGSGGAGEITTPMSFNFGAGSIVITGSNKSAADLFDEILGEGKRRARSQLGDVTRWSDVQV